jgi:hypothetical protein
MANTLLSPTAITREFLAILHQKLNFVSSINRQYDDRFANSGATMSGKVGPTLTIRKPNRYTVRSGATLAVQDVQETSILLTQATQKGIDLNFTSGDLTLTIDEFSARYIQPAAAALAAQIESDALSCALADSAFGTQVGASYTDDTVGVNNHAMGVANVVGTAGTTSGYAQMLSARQRLMYMLAPMDNRSAQLEPSANVQFLSDTKGLFQDSKAISQQYIEGRIGRVAGIDFFENSLTPTITTGSRSASGVTLSAATTEGSNQVALTGLVGTGTVKKGETFTIAGVYAVHPETKTPLPYLQPFVVLADATATASAATVTVWPTVFYTSGATKPFQNVSAQPASSAAVTWLQPTASTTYSQSLVYHRDAFAFVSADLVMPQGVDFTARAQSDGISCRLVRQYDINNDKFPTRVDVLYGIRTLRPHLAVRVTN